MTEAIMDELMVIHEYVEDMPHIKRSINSLDKRLTKLEARAELVYDVVQEHTELLKDHTAKHDNHRRELKDLKNILRFQLNIPLN